MSIDIENLSLVQQFLVNQSARVATLNTDGQGNYWTSTMAFNPVTGAALANTVQTINVTTAQAALTSLQQFSTLVQSATVGQKPASLTI